MKGDRIKPIDGLLYVVRWERLDGRDVKHKYFRRLTDAKMFAQKLDQRLVGIYVTNTNWADA